jgi:glycolate oxidase FAD binding subunit
LKVLPAPEATGTLVLPGLDAVAGVAALSAGLGSPFGVSAAAWLPAASAALVPHLVGFGRTVALLRIEDFSPSVAYRIAKLRDTLGVHAAEILQDGASRAVWRAVRDARPLQALPNDAVWRVSVRPSAGPGVLRAAADTGARGFLDWGGGLVWLAGPADAATHAAVETAARAAHGTWTLLRAPESVRVAVSVVPPEPPPLAAITRRVKTALDPRGILNPGRIYAGI